MIVDGNYEFLDFEKVKPFLIDVFCRYYGYENEEEIKIKLDNVTYHGWHDYRDVVDYYNNQIEKYRDEIVKEFYSLINAEDNSRITDILFPKDHPITNSIINIACEGGEDIGDSYTISGIEDIKNCRSLLSMIFKLDDYDNPFEEIINLKKCLNKAINKIEKRHPCDVFNDTRAIINARKKVFKKYLSNLSELGINIHINDGIILGSEEFDDSSLYNMDTYEIYFDDEYLEKGIVSSFLDGELDEMNLNNRYNCLMSRLQFIQYAGGELKYISDFKDIHINKDGFDLLMKEYEYQKNHFVKLCAFTYEDEEKQKKEWKKGNFLPQDLAQAIENSRNELQNELFLKCKNLDYYTRCRIQLGFDGATSYHFNVNDQMKPYYHVYVNESNDKDYTLSVLMHELNHVMGFYPVEMRGNYLNCKEGLADMSFNFLEKYTEESSHWDEDEETAIVQENINQRLARYLTELYLKYYENPYSKSEMKRIEKSQYEDYDFITQDFYEACEKAIKKNVLAKNQRNIYYDSEGYYEKKGIIGSLARRIRGNYYKHQDDNRHKFSVGDVKTLGSIIGFFEKEVLYYRGVMKITPEQMESGEYKNILDKEGAERLEYVLNELEKFKKILDSKKDDTTKSVRKREKNDLKHEK